LFAPEKGIKQERKMDKSNDYADELKEIRYLEQ
jgi:hypothetical protein